MYWIILLCIILMQAVKISQCSTEKLKTLSLSNLFVTIRAVQRDARLMHAVSLLALLMSDD